MGLFFVDFVCPTNLRSIEPVARFEPDITQYLVGNIYARRCSVGHFVVALIARCTRRYATMHPSIRPIKVEVFTWSIASFMFTAAAISRALMRGPVKKNGSVTEANTGFYLKVHRLARVTFTHMVVMRDQVASACAAF